MIIINEHGIEGAALEPYGYIGKKRPLSRLLLPLTRWLRAVNAERYMGAGDRHLDIGCGDGYFLLRSKCRERIGLDKLLGDDVTDALAFPDNHFDYVTMLAVIEHVADPRGLLAEVARVLKPGGRMIMTTPKQAADALIRLYVDDVDEQHEDYFDLDSITRMAAPLFDVAGHHTFLLGLNQVFWLSVKKTDG
jgi:SAM-dependent methyltransferase